MSSSEFFGSALLVGSRHLIIAFPILESFPRVLPSSFHFAKFPREVDITIR